jgi:hypothetical protein
MCISSSLMHLEKNWLCHMYIFASTGLISVLDVFDSHQTSQVHTYIISKSNTHTHTLKDGCQKDTRWAETYACPFIMEQLISGKFNQPERNCSKAYPTLYSICGSLICLAFYLVISKCFPGKRKKWGYLNLWLCTLSVHNARWTTVP